MESGSLTVLIMAAGTGGHVFPALSIAETFRSESVSVEWLGTPGGMENDLLKNTDIPLHQVSVKGLRGAGWKRLLYAPFMLLRAFIDSFAVLRKVNPDLVIGMGGFVCGPAGLACKLQGRPLFIHEQNAVAGLTNKLLSPIATKVFETFPKTFSRHNVLCTGNPLRAPIKQLALGDGISRANEDHLRILILGGSQGAQAINRLIPGVIAKLGKGLKIFSWHQTGQRDFDATEKLYQSLGLTTELEHRITPFIQDMVEAFLWADLVICRSGASTVCEIAAAGLPAIFVPYPHHKDQQQTHNANWLAGEDAAIVIQQKDLDENSLASILEELGNNRDQLISMGNKSRSLAVLDADQRIVSTSLESVRG